MNDASADRRVQARGSSQIFVGRFTYGISGVTVHTYDQGANLRIGDFCSLAVGIDILLGGEHPLDRFTTYPFGHPAFVQELGGENISFDNGSKGDVLIGNDVWIGRDVTIMSGITIGDGAVIAANAHVHRDVAPYEIVGGNPIRHIRFRMDEELRKLMLELRWWELENEQIKEISSILYMEKPTAYLIRQMLIAFRGHHPEAD
jgi:acetyltransferase-like isoleucine patch superfamily enzyme